MEWGPVLIIYDIQVPAMLQEKGHHLLVAAGTRHV